MTVSNDSRVDARAFRDTLGQYPSGITVISGLARDGVPIGFTCQSFYSVSIDPPLVSFCAGVDSTTYPRIREIGRFTVNVLAREQQDVANQFARRGTDKWAGIEWSTSPNDGPIIVGAVMWLDCELHTEHAAGDHVIVVGRVVGMSARESHTREPLLYFRGRYRHLRPGGGHT
jgi:flavin reductase (DIM6/NTAB) family NADH-FMN oxidoreductase RutF